MYIIDKYNNFFEKIYNYYIVISKEDSKKIQINRKKEHSYRVRENSLVIGESLNLNKKDIFMVNIISLFHDIGRAKQFYIYNTYVDSNSKNHALIGIDIIKKFDILKDFNEEEKEIIYDSIYYHNVKDLPKDINTKVYLYTTILRDSDKVDWLYGMVNVIPKLPLEEQKVFYSGRSNYGSISKKLVNDILDKKTINISDLKNIDELRVFGLSYITSDINYDKSIEIIQNENIIKKIYKLINKSKESEEIYKFIIQYIETKTKTSYVSNLT